MDKEPNISNASDSSNQIPRPKLSLRNLGLQKKTSAGDNATEDALASPDTTSSQPSKPMLEEREPTSIDTDKGESKRLKLKLSGASKDPVTEDAKKEVSGRKLSLKQTSKPTSLKKEPASTAQKTIALKKKPEAVIEHVEATPPSAETPAPKQADLDPAPSVAVKLKEPTVTPRLVTPVRDESAPVPTIENQLAEPVSESKSTPTETAEVATPLKKSPHGSIPPFDHSDEGGDGLMISTFPRRESTPVKQKRTKPPITVKSDSEPEEPSNDATPPAVSIDTLRPSVSRKAPPPIDAPLFEGKIKAQTKKKKPKALIGCLLIFTVAAAALYNFLATNASDTPAPVQTSPVETSQSEVATPEAVTPTPPSEGPTESPQSLRSEEAAAFVNSLPLTMVRNSGAESILIAGGVAYRIGGLIDPQYELRFIGFTKDGKKIVFEDGDGRRYSRSF